MRTRYISNTLHLESSTSLYNPGLCRQPAALGFIIVGFQVSFATGIGAILTAFGPALLQIGLSIGLTLVSNLLNPAPKPEDVQGNIRQSTPVRGALYGRGLLGGAWAFAGTYRGEFHKLVVTSSRKLSAINAIWVDDKIVTRDGSGWVTDAPFNGVKLRILTRLGATPETHYSELEGFFPEWDEDHRGDGVASIYARQRTVRQEKLTDFFPGLHNTLYRMDANGVALFDPTDEDHDIDDDTTWTYSDNLARVVMDYLWHPDGMRIPVAMLTTALALEGWVQAVDDCNDAIPLKAGGTEPRYRCWNFYQYSERPGDVLRRMMAAGAARLKPTPDGGITLEVGKWREPTVTIDDTCIVSFSDVGRGKDIRQTANTIRATFTSPDHEFQTTDADPWIEEADVAERGEINADRAFTCSPSHGQTRRLMKIEAHRARPAWVGTFVLNLKGLQAFGEQFIDFAYTPFGIDGTFEVLDFNFLIGEGMILVGAQITIQSMTEAAFEWDAGAEEGTAPPFDEIDEDGDDIPDVEDFTATLVRKTISGVPLPYARLAWTAPEDGLTVQIRGKKTTDGAWTLIGYDPEETTVDWLMSEEGATYEFEARLVSTGSEGDYIDSVPSTLQAVSNPIAPVALTSFAITGAVTLALGHAPLSFTTVNDSNLVWIALYRAPTGVALNKTTHFVTRIPALRGSTFAYVDGDNTVASIAPNGDFATDPGGWTKGTGATISGGKLNKTPGTASNSYVTVTGGAMTADVYRYGLMVSARTAGSFTPFTHSPTFTLAPTTYSSNGQKIGVVTPPAGNTLVGFNMGSTYDGSIDDFYFYKQTVNCAPQGDWDYYAIPENSSLVEGPQSGPLNIIIV